MTWDDIVARAVSHGDAGADVHASRLTTGDPCLTDGDAWIAAESLVDLEEVR